MKVWTNDKFTGFYPVGTAAVVVAESAKAAAALLNEKLREIGLPESANWRQFKVLPINKPFVRIICDGDY